MNIRGDAIYICELCDFKTKYTYNSPERLSDTSKLIEEKHMKEKHPNREERERA